MGDIAINTTGGDGYEVTIDGTSRHRVTVPARLAVDNPERVVRASFEFLLEREPASSILPEFSLEVIGRYFPEYEQELARRLG